MSTPDALTVELAGETDIRALLALIQSAYRGEPSRAGWTTEADLLEGQRMDEPMLRALMATANCRMLIIREADGTALACCQVQLADTGLAYFGTFSVRPARQGTGIGSRLLRAAEDYALAAWNAASMEMTVLAQRPDLIAYYQRRGYRLTSQRREFPYGEERYGLPSRPDLYFRVLIKDLGTRG